MPRRGLLLLLALSLAGCGDGLIIPGTAEVVVTTDRDVYEAQYVRGDGEYREYQFTIKARVRNSGTGTVFLNRCLPTHDIPIYGIRMVGEDPDAVSGYSPIWACVGHEQLFRLDPGEIREFVFHPRAPNMWNGRTGEHVGLLEGTMRLHIGVRRTPGVESKVQGQGQSAPFEVLLAE